MPVQPPVDGNGNRRTRTEFDAVVVGAGFGGMYMLHKLRQLGMETIVYEAAPDVGGTWYWNAYPGARCDVESIAYNYSFDSDLRAEYTDRWPERYSGQQEILTYARHVAERFDLRRDIQFETRVTRAVWDDQTRRWTVETDRGDRVRTRYLISAVGCLSAAQLPDIPGLETFAGDWYHTGRWPHEPVSFEGKRVAQIGTGSSGVQAAPVIAQEAAHLTVLQRTPQYTIPARNMPLTPELIAQSMAFLEQRMAEFQRTAKPFWELMATKGAFDDTPEEREAYLEQLWQTAGIGFAFGYRDTMTDLAANEEAAEFVRRKIRAIVNDPDTAAKLMPTYPIGTKRQIIDSGYYEMYNRPNVSLEDIRSDPIERIVADGLVLRSGKLVEADIIVFATGFDAMTGPIFALELEGVGGQRIAEAWKAGPQTFLGIASHGFPNAFFLTGPGSPSVLSNVITSIEQHVNWLADLLVYLDEHGIDRIEADLEHQERWVAYVNELAHQTLFPQADSWYMGANIPGKPRVFMPYLGGNWRYQLEIDEVAANGYEGFCLEVAASPMPA